MSVNDTVYEVIVEVKQGEYYGAYWEGYHNKGKAAKREWMPSVLNKMVHIIRRTKQQAIKEGQKHGRVIHCRKADMTAMLGNPETLKLDQPSVYGINPYKTAVAMDEMIGQKRVKRRKYMQKDKEDH
jgi:hypothetical protein